MKKNISRILLICIVSVCIFNTNVLALEHSEDTNDNSKVFTVCIDPGHQAKGDTRLEPSSPDGNQRKARVSSGTAGVATKRAEYIVNLEASIILRDILKEKGYNVVMTRETHDVNLSNVERAQIANKANADITVRVHCDSISNGGKTGASILVPAKKGKYTKNIYEKSNSYAQMLKGTLKENGVNVLGIFERDDITGFNWSTVPVVILEMGFMSNWNEDQMLSNTAYQRKLMQSTADAIEKYKDSITK